MDERDAEIEALRAQVAELERRLARQAAEANAAIAAAQARAYWLDRWHVDLDRWVRSPYGDFVRASARAVRAPIRRARLWAREMRRR